MLEDYHSAERVLQAIWESQVKDLGTEHAETLATQYELGYTQSLRQRWAAAQHNFACIWERRKERIQGVSESQNEADRLKAGYLLAICLWNQNRYRDTVSVLTEVYQRRVAVLGQNADETKTTLRVLERAQRALALQTQAQNRAGAAGLGPL
jgi:hypothetical protein